jgi:hypothetical protein
VHIFLENNAVKYFKLFYTFVTTQIVLLFRVSGSDDVMNPAVSWHTKALLFYISKFRRNVQPPLSFQQIQ